MPPPLDALATELGQPVLRLSANENPLGSLALAVAAIRREAERIHLYPDGGAPALAEAVAGTLGVARPSSSSATAATRSSRSSGALLEPGDEVVVPSPRSSRTRPPPSSPAPGGRAEPAPRLPHRPRDVLARIGPRTKLVCLSSPHNPTGTVLDRAPWERFCASCPDDVVVLLDEAYVDFIEAPDRAADGLATLRTRPESLVLLRTFSKITGWGPAWDTRSRAPPWSGN